MPPLRLDGLDDRHVGLTPPIAASYAEAATVCLSRTHTSPIVVTVHGHDGSSEHELAWTPPSDRVANAWANETDATRDGAYAMSLAALEVCAELVAVRRAETLTGSDYYVAPIGEPANTLENCLRLEVSGMQKGELEAIRRRLIQKQAQARRGESNLPAVAAVVGFASRTVIYAPVDQE